ncbi:MAG: Fmu (Sun) domain-containing protein [Bacteroidetes bacterium]|nr:Fmu (Sun) domain-containing protein [Bacteroidota bacterium]
MMRYLSHFNSAVQILGQYKGGEPFSFFIKNFFRQQKKFGATDRKTISHFCYCYFRLGHALKNSSVEDQILIGLFLCNHFSNSLLKHLKPEWDEQIGLSLQEKLSLIGYPSLLTDIFPWGDELSSGIDYEIFCASFLVQPDLFLRLRPGFEERVKEKLMQAEVAFAQLSSRCIALGNGVKIEGLIEINREAVIQDYSSQLVANFFEPSQHLERPSKLSVWDCCAASGGKSIMAKDVLGDMDLTVSDIRESILANLKKRFEEAGIKKFRAYIADLSTANNKLPSAHYDLVIADLPCSGSGTWGRSPEALLFFERKEIQRYQDLQRKIIANVVTSLKKKGKLVYITCSVFKKENEDMLSFIQEQYGLRLEKMELIKGYDKKADTLFAASFISG